MKSEGEKSTAPPFICSTVHGYAFPGKKDHRNRLICRNQRLDFQAVNPGILRSENQAAEESRRTIKEVLFLREDPHAFAMST